jgi:hypothetical protein
MMMLTFGLLALLGLCSRNPTGWHITAICVLLCAAMWSIP